MHHETAIKLVYAQVHAAISHFGVVCMHACSNEAESNITICS